MIKMEYFNEIQHYTNRNYIAKSKINSKHSQEK